MATIDDARMPSLRDKQIEQDKKVAEAKESKVEKIIKKLKK